MRHVLSDLLIEPELTEVELLDLSGWPARRVDLGIAGRELLVRIAKKRHDRHQPEACVALLGALGLCRERIGIHHDLLGEHPLPPANGDDLSPGALQYDRVAQHKIRRKSVRKEHSEREQVPVFHSSTRRHVGSRA